MSKKRIETHAAPAAIGPYSQAVQAGDTIYVSGQIPLDPMTGEIVEGGIEKQTSRESISAILKSAGSDIIHVVKSEVFLKDMNHFAEMNAVYAKFFTGEVLPARQAVEVARLPKDVLIEISVIAYTG